MFSLKTRRLLRWLLPAAALLTAAGRPCRPVLYRRPQAEYALPGAVPRPGGGRLLLAGGDRLAHPGGAGPLLRLYQGHRGQRLHGSPLLVQLGGGPENRPAGGGVPFLQLRQPGGDAGR